MHVHAVTLLVRVQATAAARDDVHLMTVAHELLGELAHVARQTALDDRRVLHQSVRMRTRPEPTRQGTGGAPTPPKWLAAVVLAADEHVVARPQVHRQVALDRVPVVVLLDELVELVEAGALRDG